MNFKYAAHSYINDWLGWEKRFHDTLSPKGENPVDPESGARVLAEVAAYYRVARTLPERDESSRLISAYQDLLAIPGVTVFEVPNVVDGYAEALNSKYGRTALSAASKFLWVRFREPVIIYDSITSDWLARNAGFRYNGYRDFCEAWLNAYQLHEDEIRDACYQLNSIRPFILNAISERELNELSSETWFMKRVFDYAMIYLPVTTTTLGA